MIVQISRFQENTYIKDSDKSSFINLILSGIDPKEFDRMTKIFSQLNVKLETFNKTSPQRNYLSLPKNNLDLFLKELINADLQIISDEIKKVIVSYNRYNKIPVKIGDVEFKSPLVMGILNVTPDSFSDGGKYLDQESAVLYAMEMFENGADIVDIGGESTRPGSESVPEGEELKRVIPVIEKIFEKNPNAVFSIDTTKSKVAEEACKRGVQIINDISGLTFDNKIADVANKFSASLIVMHIKGTPQTMQVNPVYSDLIFEIFEFLYNQTEAAKKAGVKNIIIDPGIGFGKNIEHNFEILKRLNEFKSLGYPILIGLSRKSFIGKSLELDIKDRDTATVVGETVAISNGAKIIRTHNVPNAVRTKKILNLINTN